MSMYNLLEYSKNYRKTIGSLYNHYRDELSNDADVTYNVDAGAQGYDVNKNGTLEVELAIPLKYLGNFWRALNIPLISCEVSLELK